jgi:tetratricopeptide (TPR) repeat protein
MRNTFASFLCLWIVTGLGQSSMSSVPTMVSPKADSSYFAGNWKEAISLYQRFLQTGNTVTPLVYYRLAYALHQSGDLDQALKYYYNCLSKNPNPNLTRVTMVNLSKTFSLKNNLDSAEACLTKAMAMGYANLNDLESSTDFAHFRSSKGYTRLHDQLFNTTYPCVTQAEARWFDFWTGEWKAYQTGTQTQAGISKIEKIAGECAILENWTDDAHSFNGKSINFYNKKTGKWEQHWVGSAGGYQKFENGEYRDGAMRFTFLRYNPDGTESIGKFTFFNQGADQVRQLSESSNDQGKTWTVDYDFTYFRIKDKM